MRASEIYAAHLNALAEIRACALRRDIEYRRRIQHAHRRRVHRKHRTQDVPAIVYLLNTRRAFHKHWMGPYRVIAVCRHRTWLDVQTDVRIVRVRPEHAGRVREHSKTYQWYWNRLPRLDDSAIRGRYPGPAEPRKERGYIVVNTANSP